MPNVNKLVLIGAGSAVFTRGLLADLISATDLGAWDVHLVDIDPEALSVAERMAQRMVTHRGVQETISISASTERTEALPGADFVVTCVGVGGRPAWLADHETCLRHGVHQPVGDSVMPGGISRLLRMIPVMVEIAADVVALAPDAMLFNYSNPMTANVMAMVQYAGARTVGLCHGMMHIQRELATLIDKPFEETSTLYAGLNHLTFIYDFRWRGEDAWPLVAEVAARQLARTPAPEQVGAIFPERVEAWNHPFCWELFDHYGAFPAAGDRHVTEFFPERFADGSYYGKTLGDDAFSVPEILAWGEDRYETMKREATGEAPLDESFFHRSTGDQEQLIAILRSILGDTRDTFSVNVPNRGILPGLPDDAVLELPGIATSRGLRPMAVPDFPEPLKAIIARRLAPVSIAIEAALTGDRDLVVEAMMLDGAVTDPAAAGALTDDLLAVQAQFLPNFATG
jgi:alpha-galactosidase